MSSSTKKECTPVPDSAGNESKALRGMDVAISKTGWRWMSPFGNEGCDEDGEAGFDLVGTGRGENGGPRVGEVRRCSSWLVCFISMADG
jgi:hypothetical protein